MNRDKFDISGYGAFAMVLEGFRTNNILIATKGRRFRYMKLPSIGKRLYTPACTSTGMESIQAYVCRPHILENTLPRKSCTQYHYRHVQYMYILV